MGLVFYSSMVNVFISSYLSILSCSFIKATVDSSLPEIGKLSLESDSNPKSIDSIKNYDPDHEIFALIDEACPEFPEPITRIVISYDSNRSLIETMIIVANELGSSAKDLDPNDFLKNLVLMIKENKIKFSGIDIFWYNLKRFLLKIFIYLQQQKMENNIDNSEFSEASNHILLLINHVIIHSNVKISEKFVGNIVNLDSFHSNFLNSEFLEYSKDLTLLFVGALKYFYSPLISKEGKENGKSSEITCKSFLSKFFKDGNPENDILLEQFMKMYDYGNLIRACLEHDTQPDYSKIEDRTIERIQYIINELEESGNITCLTNIPNVRYANRSMINFLESNNKRFLLETNLDIYYFLQKMKELKIFKKKTITSIVVFGYPLFEYLSNIEDLKFHLESRLIDSSFAGEQHIIRKCLDLLNSLPFE